MVSISRPLPAAQEAGVKYFFLGAMAAAVMLFGFSYLYGTTGLTKLNEIRALFNAPRRRGARRAPHALHARGRCWRSCMLLAGFAFKIAAVPLHVYAGDVYQGAATPVTAFLAFVPKTSGFVAIIKMLSAVGGARLARAAGGRQAAVGAGRADDDGRQRARPAPAQRQARARLQLDRPQRLHARRPHRPGRRRRRRLADAAQRRSAAAGAGGRAVLPRRLRDHERRRVRRADAPAEPRAALRPRRRHAAPRPARHHRRDLRRPRRRRAAATSAWAWRWRSAASA